MSSKHPRNDGPVRTLQRASPTEEQTARRANPGGPQRLDPGDNGRPTLKTWQDVLKIFVAVTIWFATTDAAAALREAAKYTDLGKTISLFHLHLGGVPNIVLWGAILGIAHGLILGIKALVFMWVGPTFFEYLYPVFVAASRISARVVNDVRKGWLEATGPGDDPGTMAPTNAAIEPEDLELDDDQKPPAETPPPTEAKPPGGNQNASEPPKDRASGKAEGDDRRGEDTPEPPK